MTLRKIIIIIIFGLNLICIGLFYVKFSTNNKIDKTQGLLDKPIYIKTNARDLSVSIIAETDNNIIVKTCETENIFPDCTTNELYKVSEHNGVKVYRRGNHQVAFIKDNGKWKTVGNVFILNHVMKEIEKQPEPIFGIVCGDWGITITEETEKDIQVEDCVWGMGWGCRTYNMQKISDQDGIKIYKKDEVMFTNNNGKWKLIGHMCAGADTKRKTDPIFQENCMDFEMVVKSETENEITVKRDFRKTYSIPKVAEQDGIKVYSDGNLLYHKDREAFINDNGKWTLLGHLCSEVNSTEVLTYKCPKHDRIIKVNSYDNYGLIVVEIQDPHASCEAKDDVLFMLKDKSITDKDVFKNTYFRIERTKNDWLIDQNLCDNIKSCSTSNW